MMDIASVLKKDRIILDLDAKDKNEALAKLTDLLFESGALNDKDAFLGDVLSREEISTTGIGNGNCNSARKVIKR